jgi:hypothetical protein
VEALVPRAEYTKPPKPPREIRHSDFRFSGDQRRKLTKLLPSKLAELTRPVMVTSSWSLVQGSLVQEVKTIADHVIQITEDIISAYRTAEPLISESPVNPANVRAFIHQLRQTQKQWDQVRKQSEYVDDETFDILPAEVMGFDIVSADVDAKLAKREQELAQLRTAPARRRALRMLCQGIRMYVGGLASAAGEKVGEQDMLCYIDAALNFAGIKHPNFSKYRRRFAAWIFPEN